MECIPTRSKAQPPANLRLVIPVDGILVNTPSLEAFKAGLDVALGSLGCWLATLHVAGGWNWMSIVVLFNPGYSVIL